MKSEEIIYLLTLDYANMVEYFKMKYGQPIADYFVNFYCRSRNVNISRSDDGLFCHHIDEISISQLSSPAIAQRYSYKHQVRSSLIYCNVLEHAILHMKICLDPKPYRGQRKNVPFWDGLVDYILPIINDFYMGYLSDKTYLQKAYVCLENSYEAYVFMLRWFFTCLQNKRKIPLASIKKYFCKGYMKRSFDRLYIELITPSINDAIHTSDLSTLISSAEKKDVNALLELGDLYYYGVRVIEDLSQAFVYYDRYVDFSSEHSDRYRNIIDICKKAISLHTKDITLFKLLPSLKVLLNSNDFELIQYTYLKIIIKIGLWNLNIITQNDLTFIKLEYLLKLTKSHNTRYYREIIDIYTELDKKNQSVIYYNELIEQGDVHMLKRELDKYLYGSRTNSNAKCAIKYCRRFIARGYLIHHFTVGILYKRLNRKKQYNVHIKYHITKALNYFHALDNSINMKLKYKRKNFVEEIRVCRTTLKKIT